MDWKKFTAHNNQDRMITCTASNIHVTLQSSIDQARHRTAKAQLPYNHNTSKQDAAIQSALLGGVHADDGVETMNSKKRKLITEKKKQLSSSQQLLTSLHH